MKELQKLLSDQGLVYLGTLPLTTEPDIDRYLSWLKKGFNASMGFLENHFEIRRQPAQLLEGAASVIVFALPYGALSKRSNPTDGPRVAAYAQMPDYHKSMRKLAGDVFSEFIKKQYHSVESQFRVVVDSAPILERSHASRTGRGFVGKNSCFISNESGSFVLLGSIVTTLSLAEDKLERVDPSKRVESGGCGSCRRCQVHCPTGALTDDYILDANKCLSYWTIENREVIPVKYWRHLADYWYGCDKCQDVCPYNRIDEAKEQKLDKNKIQEIDLFDIARMDQDFYVNHFGGSALTRAKISGLRRNAFIAMVATSDERVDEVIEWQNNNRDELLQATIEQLPEYLDFENRRS